MQIESRLKLPSTTKGHLAPSKVLVLSHLYIRGNSRIGERGNRDHSLPTRFIDMQSYGPVNHWIVRRLSKSKDAKKINGTAVPNSWVAILDTNGNVVANVSTDASGAFSAPIPHSPDTPFTYQAGGAASSGSFTTDGNSAASLVIPPATTTWTETTSQTSSETQTSSTTAQSSSSTSETETSTLETQTSATSTQTSSTSSQTSSTTSQSVGKLPPAEICSAFFEG